jgi:RNA polymerase sigma-70 factor, ECF subfamily
MPDTAEPRDIALLRRLASGDEGAFLEFYRRHQGGIYRYAVHMTGRPEAAADVVQETFLTLIQHAGKFDEDKGAPGAFLYGIARNHVRKLHGKESRYVALGDETSEGYSGNGSGGSHSAHGPSRAKPVRTETVLEGLERSEAIQRLRDAVLTLPEHYREPLTMCDLEGKSYEEASVLMACPVGTVRSRLNRARSILLEKLRPGCAGAKALGTRTGGNE